MQDFLTALSQPNIDMPRVALLMARYLQGDTVNVDHYLIKLDELASQAASRSFNFSSEATRAEQLVAFLYNEVPLKGNIQDYSDPRNSFISAVLDRGLGIPISLSVIFVAVAQRLGLDAYGIGLPGHFICGVGDDNHAIYVDPFNGKRLSGSDCVRLVRETTGYTGPFQSDWLQRTPIKQILFRMLNNLRLGYMRSADWDKAVLTLDMIECVMPNLDGTMRDRGLISLTQGKFVDATRLLEQYLIQQPEGLDKHTLEIAIAPAVEKWAGLN